MSNYQTRGVVNRYWKRPKPRVYDCNVRDAERFYQQSYKDYLEAKEYAAKKASEDRTSSYGLSDSSTSRWGIKRSNSLLDTVPDPTSSYDSSSRGSYLNSSRQYGDDSSSATSTLRASLSRNRSPDTDISGISDRLQRLQKLRSELGLPSEANGTTSSSKVTFQTPDTTSVTSSYSKRNTSPGPRERRGRTVDVSSSSYSKSSLGSSRSKASDLTSDSYGDSGTERSSRFSKYSSNNDDSTSSYRPRQNGRASSYSREEPETYSFKSSLKKERKYDLDDDDDISYKPKSKVDFKSSRPSAASASAFGDDDDCDADAFLSNIKKKFPTSDEILERIKKMDSDI